MREKKSAIVTMTTWKIAHVSSETAATAAQFVSEPLLNSNWMTSDDSKLATMTVQFAAPTAIRSLHFVNNGAAFVEVFVTNDVGNYNDYKKMHVLMPIQLLAGPSQEEVAPVNRSAHVFDSARFDKMIGMQSWKSMTIVLTQPFMKYVCLSTARVLR